MLTDSLRLQTRSFLNLMSRNLDSKKI